MEILPPGYGRGSSLTPRVSPPSMTSPAGGFGFFQRLQVQAQARGFRHLADLARAYNDTLQALVEVGETEEKLLRQHARLEQRDKIRAAEAMGVEIEFINKQDELEEARFRAEHNRRQRQIDEAKVADEAQLDAAKRRHDFLREVRKALKEQLGDRKVLDTEKAYMKRLEELTEKIVDAQAQWQAAFDARDDARTAMWNSKIQFFQRQIDELNDIVASGKPIKEGDLEG